MKVALPLAKNVLPPLGLTEEEDMKDIMKIIEALENSGILLKRVSKTIKNETKEQIRS